MDIICLSTTDWDEIWGSRQQLMLRLHEMGHRILFVERQVGPEQLLRDPALRKRKYQAWKQAGKLIRVKDNLWLLNPPVVPPGRYYAHVLNLAGQKRIAKALTQPIKSLGFQ